MISKEKRIEFKKRLRNRDLLFGGWISFGHPSIAEIFARAGFDFIAIDIEHSTISLAETQRIIAASQSYGVPCLPRPVSHNNDFIKPILDSGADGLIVQMVENPKQLSTLVDLVKFAPIGRRSFGVSRAHGYGFDFASYVKEWNESSLFIIQIESKEGVENIEKLIIHEQVDGVMIGPYDMSGSYGVPGEVNHPIVREAAQCVIDACKKAGKACGTQIADVTPEAVKKAVEDGYTFIFFSSDLFILWKWSEQMQGIMKTLGKIFP